MNNQKALNLLFAAMIISTHIFKHIYYKSNKKIFWILACILFIANLILLIFFLDVSISLTIT